MGVDPNPPDMTLDQLRYDQNAFLVPDDLDGQQDAERWVQRRWQMLFEGFLAEWYTVESWWPQKRTFKMFKEWFDIQYHSTVWDMLQPSQSAMKTGTHPRWWHHRCFSVRPQLSVLLAMLNYQHIADIPKPQLGQPETL